jgi:mannan endo-1,4-beta-mannosidase
MAADVYRGDWRKSHQDELQALAPGKPIALGEVGEPPTPALITEQNRWVWFMPWPFAAIRGKNPERLRQIYADPRLISLEDIRVDAEGRYEVHGH